MANPFGDYPLRTDITDGTDQATIHKDLHNATSRAANELQDTVTALPSIYAPIAGAWEAPVFQNSWAGATGRYRKRGTEVDIEASPIAGGANGSVCFTLPVGYRPVQDYIFTIITSGGVGFAVVATSGTVTLTQLSGSVSLAAYFGRMTLSTL